MYILLWDDFTWTQTLVKNVSLVKCKNVSGNKDFFKTLYLTQTVRQTLNNVVVHVNNLLLDNLRSKLRNHFIKSMNRYYLLSAETKAFVFLLC